MDYPEFNKRIGEKIAILTFPGIIKCATEAFKLLINFQFPSKPPNSKPSLILPIPFPEAKFHGIPVNSKRINGRFAVGFKRL